MFKYYRTVLCSNINPTLLCANITAQCYVQIWPPVCYIQLVLPHSAMCQIPLPKCAVFNVLPLLDWWVKVYESRALFLSLCTLCVIFPFPCIGVCPVWWGVDRLQKGWGVGPGESKGTCPVEGKLATETDNTRWVPKMEISVIGTSLWYLKRWRSASLAKWKTPVFSVVWYGH